MPKEAKAAGEYALGRDRHETERLQSQAGFIEPFTERLFRDAGIGIGMKVLDVGSGTVAQRLDQVRLNSWAQRARVTVRSADKTGLPRWIACVAVQRVRLFGLMVPRPRARLDCLGQQPPKPRSLAAISQTG